MTCPCGNCKECNAEWTNRAPMGNVQFHETPHSHGDLRDQIAIAALQGIITKHGTYDEAAASKSAYAFADAMLIERDAA